MKTELEFEGSSDLQAPAGHRVVDQEIAGGEAGDFDFAGGVIDGGVAHQAAVKHIVTGAWCAKDIIKEAFGNKGAEICEIGVEFESRVPMQRDFLAHLKVEFIDPGLVKGVFRRVGTRVFGETVTTDEIEHRLDLSRGETA